MNINITKKHLYILTGLVVVFSAIVFVLAAGQQSHTADEISGGTISGSLTVEGEICGSAGCLGSSGNTFIRWGRTTCPTNTELIYEGYAAGAHYTQNGKNPICLTKTPTWAEYNDGNNDQSTIWGAEYEVNSNAIPSLTALHDYNVPCAVCYSEAPTIMNPGAQTCPNGWNVLYEGYLMSDNVGHGGNNEFTCVDQTPETIGTNANQNGALFYSTEAQCGSLPCGPYVKNRELTCSVCAKSGSTLSSGGAVQDCEEGQILKFVSGTWTCSVDNSGSGGGGVYESAWVYIDTNQNRDYVFDHNLGAFPSTAMLYTAHTDNPTWARAQNLNSQGISYSSPEAFEMSKTSARLRFYTGDNLIYCDANNPCHSGGGTTKTGYVKLILTT